MLLMKQNAAKTLSAYNLQVSQLGLFAVVDLSPYIPDILQNQTQFGHLNAAIP